MYKTQGSLKGEVQLDGITTQPVACTINIYDRRFYDHNDIGLYYKTRDDRN
jgi:hypothetical protein